MSVPYRLSALSLSLCVGASICFAPAGCGDSFQGIERDEDSGVTAPLPDGGGNTNTDAGPDATAPADADVDAAPSAKFALSTSVSSLYLDPGEQNVALRVGISRAPGFTAPVTISVNGLPSAVHTGQLTLGGTDTEGTLLFGADVSAVVGGAAISVIGATNDESASTSLALFITGTLLELTADGAVTVPAVAPPTLDFYLWGGGGAGGDATGSTSCYNNGGHGAAGGAAIGRVPVAAGEVLQARVGTGGKTKTGQSGGGGGYTALLRADAVQLLAGGGGGGGYGYGRLVQLTTGNYACRSSDGTQGGAGGGATGEAGAYTPGAQPGTASAGGAFNCAEVQESYTCNAGSAGSAFLGGGAGGATGGVPGGGAGSDKGGGGGGGYFGGGAGAKIYFSDPYTDILLGTGGGGGSGFAETTMLPIHSEGVLFKGNRQTPPLGNSPLYAAGAAVGGARGTRTPNDSPTYVAPTSGGNGRFVVVLAKP